jgi:hypothetical protein
MNFPQFRRSDRPGRSRTSRKLQLAVESCESRQLLSGATIAGASISPFIKHGNGPIAVVADTVLRKHVPDAVLRKHVPDTVLRKHVPDAVFRKHIPDAVLRKHVPDSALRKHDPDVVGQGGNPFA